jgi:hypothetical protein
MKIGRSEKQTTPPTASASPATNQPRFLIVTVHPLEWALIVTAVR